MKSASSNKLVKRIIILIIVLVVAAFLFFNNFGILKFLEVKSEVNNLNDEIRRSGDTLKTLNKEIDSLKTNRFKIEKTAREKFHMKRKNEKVLQVEEN